MKTTNQKLWNHINKLKLLETKENNIERFQRFVSNSIPKNLDRKPKSKQRSINKRLRRANKKICSKIRKTSASRNDLEFLSGLLIEQALEEQANIIGYTLPNSYERYRYECRFVFDNPDQLQYIKGYDLLCKRGLYSRKDNPFGCVKDHRVSVKYGYDNKVDPKIIGHLANCEFLSETQNLAKSSNCSITLEQLLKEIKKFYTDIV